MTPGHGPARDHAKARMISQREARRLRQRVAAFEQQQHAQQNAWSAEYPQGVYLGTWGNTDGTLFGEIRAARKLKHAVIVTATTDGVKFFAMPFGRTT